MQSTPKGTRGHGHAVATGTHGTSHGGQHAGQHTLYGPYCQGTMEELERAREMDVEADLFRNLDVAREATKAHAWL